MRRAGSGLANESADAVELALAAALVNDERMLSRQRARLETEYERGYCGVEPSVLIGWIRSAAAALPFQACEAAHLPPDLLGDVGAVDTEGGHWWIEVKAQTKKDRFGDITQSDWVRDATDATRWLAAFDSDFHDSLPADLLRELACPAPPKEYFDGWGFDDLMMADLALLPDRARRARAGVSTPADLRSFLQRKYFVHVTREGLRVCRFDRLSPAAAWLDGNQVVYALKHTNTGNVISVPVACPGPLAWGEVNFTYHLGYAGAIGRHKLHAASVDTDGCDFVVR